MASSSESSQENLNAWNFWLFDKTLGDQSRQNVTSYYNADDLKQALRNAATKDPLFPYGCTYNFFKKGFNPVWKNPNKNAGRYVLVYDALTSSEAINHLWNKLLINLTEKESWRGIRNFINGAKVEKLQNNFHKLSIWIAEEALPNKRVNYNLIHFLQDLFVYLPGLYKIINEPWSTEEIQEMVAIPMPSTGPTKPRRDWLERVEDAALFECASAGNLIKCWEVTFLKSKLGEDNLLDWDLKVFEAQTCDQLRGLCNDYELMKPGGVHNISEYRLKKRALDLHNNIVENDKTRVTVKLNLPIFKNWEEASTEWKKFRTAILLNSLMDNIENECGGGIRRFNQDGVDHYQISLWTRFHEEKTHVTSRILAQQMARGRTNTFAALFIETHRCR